MSLLRVKDLTIRYGDTTVVEDLSFDVDNGEAVGLLGESGAGKSQTALAVLGLLSSNARVSGDILFEDQSLLNCDAKTLNSVRARRIGIVFQDPMQALNPYLRIGQQLRQILMQHKLAAGRAADRRVIEMLQRVGLPDAERQFRAYPHELSGGMRQRVMIASALIAEPALLIADEPTTALDVTVQAQILDLLEALREDTALLLITHDIGIVASRCERVLVMASGQVIESGATLSVLTAPRHAHTQRLMAAVPRLDVTAADRTAVSGKCLLGVEAAVVSYTSEQRRAFRVVDDVSLSLHHGETLAIVGESGSGKSSLARAVLGLVPLESGRVVYAGETLAATVHQRAKQQRRDVQLVFQDPVGALNPQMRVAAIIEEPLRVHEPEMSNAARRQRVSAALLHVELDAAIAARFPHQLSGGQAQRVAIARALVVAPQVLICDEAVAALDGSVRQQVLALLRHVQATTGLSIVFISHDLAVVSEFADRVAVMYLGRLVEVADKQQLFSAPQHPYTRALLDAVPSPDPRAPMNAVPLRGETPSPMAPPPGCVFHPRCVHAYGACATQVPALRQQQASRVACLRAHELDL